MVHRGHAEWATCILIASFMCLPTLARSEARGLAAIELSYAGLEGAERGELGGFDAAVALRGKPLWWAFEGNLHFSSTSPFTFDGQEVGRYLLQLFVGPQLVDDGRRFRMFGHVLLGFSELVYEDPGINPDSLPTQLGGPLRAGNSSRPPAKTIDGYAGPAPALVTLDGFTVAIGGGVDVRMGQRSAIRLLRAEYMPTAFRVGREYVPPEVIPTTPDPDRVRFADEVGRHHHGWTHNFRVSVGYVYSFGSVPATRSR